MLLQWLILQHVQSFTGAAETSAEMDSTILTSDKQGSENMRQHHEQSTGERSFTDGGHSS